MGYVTKNTVMLIGTMMRLSSLIESPLECSRQIMKLLSLAPAPATALGTPGQNSNNCIKPLHQQYCSF